MTLTNVFTGLAILAAFTFLAWNQKQLKENPQLVLLGFGALTVFSLLKFEKLGNIMFFILLGLAIALIGYILTDLLLEAINPDRGTFIDNTTGERYFVMDVTSVFLDFAGGLILAPLILVLYRRKVKSNKTIETICVTYYTLATLIMYLVFEIW